MPLSPLLLSQCAVDQQADQPVARRLPGAAVTLPGAQLTRAMHLAAPLGRWGRWRRQVARFLRFVLPRLPFGPAQEGEETQEEHNEGNGVGRHGHVSWKTHGGRS